MHTDAANLCGSEQVILGSSQSEEKPKESAEAKKNRPRDNSDANHKAEWVRAIRENNPSIAWSNFSYSGVLTEAMFVNVFREIRAFLGD